MQALALPASAADSNRIIHINHWYAWAGAPWEFDYIALHLFKTPIMSMAQQEESLLSGLWIENRFTGILKFTGHPWNCLYIHIASYSFDVHNELIAQADAPHNAVGLS